MRPQMTFASRGLSDNDGGEAAPTMTSSTSATHHSLDMTMSQTTSQGRFRRLRARAAGWMLNSGGRGDGPPDLDELWRDFNRKLSGLFGGKGGPPRGNGSGDGGGPNFQPDMKSAGIGAGLVAGVVALIWLGSGFFIVQEGQQAVVTSFGKYSHTADAGFQWRMPYPFQANETSTSRSCAPPRSAATR